MHPKVSSKEAAANFVRALALVGQAMRVLIEGSRETARHARNVRDHASRMARSANETRELFRL